MSKIEESPSIEEAKSYRISLVNRLSKIGSIDLPNEDDQKFGFLKMDSGQVWVFLSTSEGKQSYVVRLEDLITENLEYIQTLINKYQLG